MRILSFERYVEEINYSSFKEVSPGLLFILTECGLIDEKIFEKLNDRDKRIVDNLENFVLSSLNKSPLRALCFLNCIKN